MNKFYLMTREEILNMPAGREMDVLIAEKLNLFLDIKESTQGDYFHEDKALYFRPFSTDIAAAWEVVEKMIRDGHNFVASQSSEKGRRPHVIFTNAKDEEDRNEWQYEDSFPLAICRAALLAVNWDSS